MNRAVVGFALGFGILVLGFGTSVSAHAGPPYPIIASVSADPYVVSVWADPDTTDDGKAGGQFWVVFERPGHGSLPVGTRATVTARALDRPGAAQSAIADPVRGDASNQFAAVLLDREGRFEIGVTLDGPLGHATLRTQVDATYDLRPARWLIAVYVAPFVLVGLLWIKLLARRQRRAT
jgi:hypothetical protein